MTPQFIQVALIAFLAAAPGLLALYLGYRRTVKRDEERQQLRAQRQEEREKFRAQNELIAQLQEQIAAQQKTIRFLAARVDELETARKQEYVETESLREETEGLRQEVRELRQGVQALIGQIESVPLTPVWRPPVQPVSAPGSGGRRAKSLASLRDGIAEQFSLEEIDDLAFRLGVEPDELVGESRSTKARSLVSHFKNVNRIEELRGLCAVLRPTGGF